MAATINTKAWSEPWNETPDDVLLKFQRLTPYVVDWKSYWYWYYGNFLEQGRLNQNFDHKERRKMKRTPQIFHSLNSGVTAFWARYELWGGTMISEGSLKRLRQTSQGKVLLYPLYSPFPFKIRKGPGNGIDLPHTALLFDCSFAVITDIPLRTTPCKYRPW